MDLTAGSVCFLNDQIFSSSSKNSSEVPALSVNNSNAS